MAETTNNKKKRRLADAPEEVVKRWGRIKMAARGRAFGRFYIRYWLLFKERRKHRILVDTFDAIKTQAIKYEHAGYSTSLTVYNIALYLLIAERDIQAVKIDALTHPDPWKRNLCTRIILLILHEWDIDKVTGERLKKVFNDLNVSPEIRKEAVESLRAIRKVKQQAQKKLGDLTA